MKDKIKIDPKAHYSLHEIVNMCLFPVSATTPSYLRFIGKEALKGNVLERDTESEPRRGNTYPIKGSSIIKFLAKIK